MIHRSTASFLNLNQAGETISLRSIMPIHEVKTVELLNKPDEEIEFQWLHRLRVRYDAIAFISKLLLMII